MARVGTVVVDVEADASRFKRDLDQAVGQASKSLVGGLGNAGKAVMGDLASGAKAAGMAIIGIGAAAVGVAANFNKEMSGVKAVASATAGELNLLREAALEAGAATSFSASEAAEAEAELAKAGVSVSDILGGGLMGSLGLAAAGQIDLANAATIAAQAMNTFGLEGKDVTHIADVLAAGANKSAADVMQLGDALRQGGLMADQTGLSLEQTVGTLSAFADRALIGSDAGTSLKTMLQRLVPVSGPAAKAMKEIGFSAFDAEGAFVGLESVAQQLREGLGKLTAEDRSRVMNKIFGSDAVRAATILYDLGAEGVREYTDAVDDSGAAQRMAADQLDNLAGDVEAFKGSVETALIRLGDMSTGPLRDLVQGGTELTNVFGDALSSEALTEFTDGLADLVGFGPGMESLAERAEAFFASLDGDTLDDLLDTIGDGARFVREFADEFEAASGVVAGLGTSFALMGAGSLPILSAFVPTLSPITAVLGGLLVGTDKGRESLGKLADEFKDVADNVGPRLADSFGEIAGVASETLVGILDALGPAVADVAEDLLPTLADALEDLAPAAGDFLVAGAELAADVLPELVDLFEAGLPLIRLAGPALEIAADAMGILGDNASILVPPLAAIVGYMKLKAWADGSKAVAGLATGFANLRSGAEVLEGVAATRGISNVSAAAGVAKASVGELGNSVKSQLLSPLGMAATAATVGVTAYTLYAGALDSAASAGKKAAESFIGLGRFDFEAGTNTELANEIERIRDRLHELRELREGSGFDIGPIEIKDPFEDRKRGNEQGGLEEYLRGLETFDQKVEIVSSTMGISEKATRELLQAQMALGEEFGTAAGLANQLNNELDKFKPAGQNVIETTADAEAALDAFSDSLLVNGTNFNAADDAGRANIDTLGEFANRARNSAAAIAEQSGDLGAASAELYRYRDAAIESMSKAGMGVDEIEAKLSEFGLSHEQIETAIVLTQQQDTLARIETINAAAWAISDADYRAQIGAAVTAGDLERAEALIDAWAAKDREVKVRVVPSWAEFVPPNFTYTGSTGGSSAPRPKPRAQPRKAEADGGTLDFYAHGGVREHRVAQIASPGTIRVWNEPETHGEGYVPFAPGKRGRALDVYDEIGRRIGADQTGGVNVTMAPGTIVVQAAPGMSEEALAEKVAEQFRRRALWDSGFLSRMGAAR